MSRTRDSRVVVARVASVIGADFHAPGGNATSRIRPAWAPSVFEVGECAIPPTSNARVTVRRAVHAIPHPRPRGFCSHFSGGGCGMGRGTPRAARHV
eukprot:4968727-Prymnesium_polylepis.4